MTPEQQQRVLLKLETARLLLDEVASEIMGSVPQKGCPHPENQRTYIAPAIGDVGRYFTCGRCNEMVHEGAQANGSDAAGGAGGG